MLDIFESIINVAPVMQKVFPFDCMMGIADTEQFIYYLPGDKLQHASPVGKRITEGDGMWEAIHHGKTFSTTIPREVWGLPFKSIQTPLRNGTGDVVGAFGFGYSLENQEILQNAVDTIVASSQQVNTSSQRLIENVDLLKEKMNTLKSSGETMVGRLKKSDKVLVIIKNIASQSNLLGFNALLEASRAGVYGRGFTVVADEMRKLSVNSFAAAKDVQDIIEGIQSEMQVHDKEIQKVDEISLLQQSVTKDISDAIASLASLAENIQKLAARV